MAKRNFTVSKMVCTNCNQVGIPIARSSSQTREEGHLKKLYCLNCREYHNHKEYRSEWDEYRTKDGEVENE